jgi:type I restriction enzyme R subunit
MLNEADTRAKLIDPKLLNSGWTEKMIVRDKPITKGMIINESGDRLPVRKPDYILYYPDNREGIPLAVMRQKQRINPILLECNKLKSIWKD